MGNKVCGPLPKHQPSTHKHTPHAPAPAHTHTSKPTPTHKPSIKAQPKPKPKPQPTWTGWDCDTTGRTHCLNPNLQDAWDSFTPVDVYDSYVTPLAYTSTTHVKPKPTPKTLVVTSINYPKTWHIFTFIKAQPQH